MIKLTKTEIEELLAREVSDRIHNEPDLRKNDFLFRISPSPVIQTKGKSYNILLISYFGQESASVSSSCNLFVVNNGVIHDLGPTTSNLISPCKFHIIFNAAKFHFVHRKLDNQSE